MNEGYLQTKIKENDEEIKTIKNMLYNLDNKINRFERAREDTYNRINETENKIKTMMETKTLRKIIEEAQEFECCPDCGNVDIESHYCPKCKERISTPYDAGWFAKYLSKKYKYKLKGEIHG